MARSFNGSSDVIDCGTAGGLNISNNGVMALSAWVNFASLSGNQQIASKGFDGTNTAYQLQISGGTDLIIGSFSGSSHQADWTFGAGLTTGQWNHILGSYDGSTWFLVVNGVLKANTTATGPISTSKKFAIGAVDINGTFGQFLNGRVAEVCLWSGTSLSLGEAAAMASGIRAYRIRPSNIVAYLPVDGISSPEPDLSGNGHNGTVTGTATVSGPPLTVFTPRWPSFNPSTAASFIPAWGAGGSNLPVLGTGTY